LSITLVLVVAYMVAEVVGGILTNSLALLADAGHMLSDAAALGLSLFAMWMAQRPPTVQRTYGYYRAEILAALANGAALVAIAFYIFIEAYQRFRDPPAVLGGTMMAIATGGLTVNIAGLAVLRGSREESLNVQGAWLHVLGDTLGSVGAMIGGLLIWWFEWYWADPVASLVIGLLILYSSWNLLERSVSVLMEHAPGHMDVDKVHGAMVSVEGVGGVHDLHVWTITTGLESLSAHVSVESQLPAAEILHGLRTKLRQEFGIDHVTLQLEPAGFEEHRPEV
jgi:cobalt-zinc-cadmium efflux system protein